MEIDGWELFGELPELLRLFFSGFRLIVDVFHRDGQQHQLSSTLHPSKSEPMLPTPRHRRPRSLLFSNKELEVCRRKPDSPRPAVSSLSGTSCLNNCLRPTYIGFMTWDTGCWNIQC